MIADVVFDTPVVHAFRYLVPAGLDVAPGQRVRAALRGGARVGVVVALREGDGAGLKPLLGVIEATPVLSPRQLDLVWWIASESLSSVGSTCATLLPPPSVGPRRPAAAPTAAGHGTPAARTATSDDRPAVDGRVHTGFELLTGVGRESRLLDEISASHGGVLVVTADVDGARRWAQRLARIDRTVRLDSGVGDGERAEAWQQLASGAARLAVGTRSALLAPLPPGSTLALVDEHEAAHRPPGHPRMHAREILRERARREGARLLLTSATPSVETWWRLRRGMGVEPPGHGRWPEVTIADTRGILRREALTPPLARAIRETLAARARVFLAVSRLASALACDDCGTILRCRDCALALSYSRAGASLTCRLCASVVPLMDTCPQCRGPRLSPFGWGAERVEHAVRRRFPKARVARYDPDARGARAEAQRQAAAGAEVVIGTRGALRLFGPASLGLAGFVTPDQLLRLPDFRAGERMFGFLWAAAERVRPEGRVLIQSQTPGYHAFAALTAQDPDVFYSEELKFRAELGYPPFRRLAVVSIEVRASAERGMVDAVSAALRGSSRLVAYPPAADRRQRSWRIVVKGQDDLPAVLSDALAEFAASRAAGRGIMDIEVDPVEWPS